MSRAWRFVWRKECVVKRQRFLWVLWFCVGFVWGGVLFRYIKCVDNKVMHSDVSKCFKNCISKKEPKTLIFTFVPMYPKMTLWNPYSPKVKFQKIKSLHQSGLGYRKIAYKLNEENIRTHRGKEWVVIMFIQFLKDIKKEKIGWIL